MKNSHFAFSAPPGAGGWGQRTLFFKPTEKIVVDFLFVLIELFSPVVTADEALLKELLKIGVRILVPP